METIGELIAWFCSHTAPRGCGVGSSEMPLGFGTAILSVRKTYVVATRLLLVKQYEGSSKGSLRKFAIFRSVRPRHIRVTWSGWAL